MGLHRMLPVLVAVLGLGALGAPAGAVPATSGPAPAVVAPTVAPTVAPAAIAPGAAVRHVGVWSAQRPGQTRVQALTLLETAMTARSPMVVDYLAWDDPLPDPLVSTAAGRRSPLTVLLKLKRRDGTRPRWADLAAAAPGSPLYADLDRYAAAFKAYPAPLYVVFHKEPNEPANVANGTATDYRKAFRAFVQHLRAAGVTNARYVWALPTTSFTGSPPAANRWYPGDDVVDVIGATGANRFGCEPGKSKAWRSFGSIFAPAHRWAALHPRQTFGVVEFESVEDPADPGRKGRWLDAAHALTLTAAWADLELASYFSSPATDGGGTCLWWLDTSPASLAAAGRWMSDPAFGG